MASTLNFRAAKHQTSLIFTRITSRKSLAVIWIVIISSIAAIYYHKCREAISLKYTNILKSSTTSNSCADRAAADLKRIKEVCEKPENYQYNEDPANATYRNSLIDDEHKLVYLDIPKTGSTLWKGIFAILTKQSNENDATKIIRYDVHHLMKFDSLRNLRYEEKYMKLSSYFVFAVVRHPFERLVSAFNDKLKYPDEFDGNYFQRKHGTRIIQKYRHKATPQEIMSGKPKFSEFIEYLIDPETVKGTINKIDHHWAQYYKIIHPCIHKFDYIVRFENFKEDTQYILDIMNLSTIVQFTYKDPVTSKDKLEFHMRQLTTNQIYKLYLAYKFDFDLFGYNFNISKYI